MVLADPAAGLNPIRYGTPPAAAGGKDFVQNDSAVDQPLSGDPAVGFDGSSQYAEVPYAPELNGAQFSVEAWAYPAGGAGTNRSMVRALLGAFIAIRAPAPPRQAPRLLARRAAPGR